MPITVTPYIPTYITVHLGAPDSYAENVTVPFPEYIKNVASSEIYPTWSPAALRANILAQISFALNRVYTEYYPSQGYDFNITGTTARDMKFIKGRNIFDSVSALVDDLFQTYIRRQGYVEPLSAKFCNGTTTTCDGLSQWGSEGLAKEGYNSVEILKYFYGDDIELVPDAPIQDIRYSYPGALRLGSQGDAVGILQVMLNQVSQAYPKIPKISPVDTIFGPSTEEAVRTFQSIFQLTRDGIVGKSTWYRLVYLYVGLLQLSELVSEGQDQFQISFAYPDAISMGNQGEKVKLLQYLLSVLAQFSETIPFVPVDGVFGEATYQAVLAFQAQAGLQQTGVVDAQTWDQLVQQFEGIRQTVLDNPALFPVELTQAGRTLPPEQVLSNATHKIQHPGSDLTLGSRDPERSVPT